MLVWGPFSYYEQRLRRLSALLHPDDPILALEDPKPAAEDKPHVVYSHRNCVNAGFIFAQIANLTAETRFGVMPNHHTDPVGAIVAPYAALASGAVLVHLHDNLFNDEHAVNVIEKLCVEELKGVLGKKADFDFILKHTGNFDSDQFEHLKWVAIFEDATTETPTTADYLDKLVRALGLDVAYVFRGPMEAAYLVSYRTTKDLSQVQVVPHVEAKVVGDRGAADAKILSRNTRGNLKLKGPHVTGSYYNNAGLLTEVVDEKGFVSTSREALVESNGTIQLLPTQVY